VHARCTLVRIEVVADCGGAGPMQIGKAGAR